MYASHYEMMQFLTERWGKARLSEGSSMGKKKGMMRFNHTIIVPWSSSPFFQTQNRSKTTSEKENTWKITSYNKNHEHKQQKYKWQWSYDKQKKYEKSKQYIQYYKN